MKKGIFLLVCLIGMASCVDHKDAFDPNAEAEKKKEDYDKNFPVTDVDPEQDWSTYRSIKVRAVVNETAGETYTMKIYTENPLDPNSGAMLLAKGEVKNGDVCTFNVELAKGFSGVYAARIDSKGACLVKYASVKDDIASVTFGTAARSARSVQAGSIKLDGVIETSPYSETEITDFLSKATELNGQEVGTLDGNYKVTGNYSLTWYPTSTTKGSLIIVAKGGTLIADKQIGQNCIVVVLGTLILKGNGEFQDAKLVVFPQGKVEGNSLNFTNAGDRLAFYNAGTVNLTGTLTVNGQRFYNCGNVNVNTYISSSNQGRFVNNGHFYTKNMNMANSDIYALCYTHIGTFTDQFKDCYVADGAYLQIDQKLYSGQYSKIYLGNNSKLSTETYYYNYTKIIAPNTYNEQAYIKIGVISSENGVGSWWLGGESTGYYTIDVNYSSWSWKNDYSKMSFEKEVMGHGTDLEGHFLSASLEITPPSQENECSADVIINGQTDNDQVNSAYYAFEDLGAVGDYDFNDVILKVSHVSGASQATVELVAAGGTLPTAVKYGNEVLWSEVHEAFGVELSTMVNTGGGTAAKEPEVKTITVDPNASFKDLRFAIEVKYSNGNTISTVESVPSTGSAPQYLYVPTTWRWPKENVRITQAYDQKGHSFEEWAQNASQAKDWYEHPNDDKVH